MHYIPSDSQRSPSQPNCSSKKRVNLNQLLRNKIELVKKLKMRQQTQIRTIPTMKQRKKRMLMMIHRLGHLLVTWLKQSGAVLKAHLVS